MANYPTHPIFSYPLITSDCKLVWYVMAGIAEKNKRTTRYVEVGYNDIAKELGWSIHQEVGGNRGKGYFVLKTKANIAEEKYRKRLSLILALLEKKGLVRRYRPAYGRTPAWWQLKGIHFSKNEKFIVEWKG